MKVFAPTVLRRGSTFPFRKERYFDLRAWGGGFLRVGSAPGAIHLKDNLMCDLRTGEVYADSRFPIITTPPQEEIT